MIVDAASTRRERILAARLAALEAANEALRERNAWLENELYGRDWACPREFRLTPTERRILAALVRHSVCSKPMLLNAAAKPGREPEADVKIVEVHVCRMRPKLAAFDIEIETLLEVGYSLSLATRRRLLAWNKGDLIGAADLLESRRAA